MDAGFILALAICVGIFVVASQIQRVAKNLEQLNQKIDAHFFQPSAKAREPSIRPLD
jgi:hypothetical protein